MKRIYMTMALLGGISLAASAQSGNDIDLKATIDMLDGQALTPGKFFSPVNPPGSADSVFGAWGVENVGPDAVLRNDQVLFSSSYGKYLTEEEFNTEQGNGKIPADAVFGEDKYFWLNGFKLTNADARVAGEFVFAYSFSPISDIGLLADWDRWNQYGCDSTLRVFGPPHDAFVSGQEYGFFVNIYGIGEATDAITNVDDDRCNNKAVARVIWDGDGSGINKAIFAPKEKVSLNVYPNPANDNLKFNYTFQKNVDVTVIVRDAVGRVVLTQDYGKMIGSQDFTVNVSSLNSGLYTIEMGTSYESAISKFSKL